MKGNRLLLFSAKSRPDKISSDVYRVQSILQEARKRFLLKSFENGNQTVQIVDKTSPHALLELMITVSSDKDPSLSFNELNSESLKLYLKLIYEFVSYIHEANVIRKFSLEDAVFRISANVAKTTEDRFSIQGERSFHVHLVCYPQDYSDGERIDLSKKENSLVKFALEDPLAKPGAALLKFIMEKRHTLNPMIISNGDKLKVGGKVIEDSLFIEFNSWKSLLDPRMDDYLVNLESNIDELYSRVLDLFYDKDVPSDLGYWERRRLLPLAERDENIASSEWIPDSLKPDFMSLSLDLKDVGHSKLVEMKRKRKFDKTVGEPELCLPYAGPTYTYVLFSQGKIGEVVKPFVESSMYLAVTPLIRRTAGAGGLFFNHNGEKIKICKNSDNLFSENEMIIRKSFQKGFLRRLTKM